MCMNKNSIHIYVDEISWYKECLICYSLDSIVYIYIYIVVKNKRRRNLNLKMIYGSVKLGKIYEITYRKTKDIGTSQGRPQLSWCCIISKEY